MLPTLGDAEVIEVLPYGEAPVRPGDVVYFRVPGKDHWVVHRVIRLRPEGIITRGDNNPTDDISRLQKSDIIGRVIAARRKRGRQGIWNGRRGLLLSRWLRGRAAARRSLAGVLRPAYHWLARRKFWPSLLPAAWRPRLVTFQSGPRRTAQLMMGRHRVGFYSPELGRWRIKVPFRLFVTEASLPPMTEPPSVP